MNRIISKKEKGNLFGYPFNLGSTCVSDACKRLFLFVIPLGLEPRTPTLKGLDSYMGKIINNQLNTTITNIVT